MTFGAIGFIFVVCVVLALLWTGREWHRHLENIEMINGSDDEDIS